VKPDKTADQMQQMMDDPEAMYYLIKAMEDNPKTNHEIAKDCMEIMAAPFLDKGDK